MVKNILITGVSQGLGLATVEAVLAVGDTVYGVSRRLTPKFQALQAQHPGRVHFKACDLGQPTEAVRCVFNDFMDLKTPLHGFVNNAAVAYDDLVTNVQLEPLAAMYAVNVFTPMLFVRHCIRNMLLHEIRGAIVHVSSISVHTGYKGLAMYASTKGALEAFSKNTAREWGERGVRSNCLVAGFMETNMSATLSNEARERIYRRTSLKQATDIASVAGTINYLLGDEARSITGQNIFVDSGTI